MDYDCPSNHPVLWDDIIDSKNNFHFTVCTFNDFVLELNEDLENGNKIVVFLDGEDKYPHVIIKKDVIRKEDISWITREYRKWLKNHS